MRKLNCLAKVKYIFSSFANDIEFSRRGEAKLAKNSFDIYFSIEHFENPKLYSLIDDVTFRFYFNLPIFTLASKNLKIILPP